MFRSVTDSPESGWSHFQVAPLSNRFFPVSLKRLSLRQEALVTLTVQPADCHDDQWVGDLQTLEQESVNIVFLVDSVIHPGCHSSDGQSQPFFSPRRGNSLHFVSKERQMRRKRQPVADSVIRSWVFKCNFGNESS